MLAYEHDKLIEQTAEACEAFNHRACQLRQTIERYSGPRSRAETIIAGEIHYARRLFLDDLRREHSLPRFNWRDMRGRR